MITMENHTETKIETFSPRKTIVKADRPKSWISAALMFHVLLIGLLLFISAGILKHPLATNDGPVHVAFSHLMLTYQQSSQPLQQLAYTIHLGPNPNLAVYFLMAALMRFFSPTLTESIIQVLCVIAPVAAGYFAIRVINPKSVWLSIFLVPLVLNQMLFLGLYNHCLSTAAFFLVIGLYFRLAQKPSVLRAAAMTGALIVTYFCHASGFVMAFTGVSMMSGTTALLAYRRLRQSKRTGKPSRIATLFAALMPQLYAVGALLGSIPPAFIFVTSRGKGPTLFGISIAHRLSQFGRLHLLAVNYPLRDRFPAIAISAVLLVAFLVVSIRILRSHPEWSTQRRDQAIGVVAATLFATLIMCIFPDTTGGGWTHFRRFEIFPFFWVILTLSFETFSFLLTGAFVAVATASSLVFITSMVVRQGMIREQMAPLAAADKLIGNHCTVLPLVVESNLVNVNQAADWMDYQPFFQSTSQLELHGDRVVLFNYLARLTPYPVHFRPQVEPQGHMFLWIPNQPDNGIEKVDLKGFESSANLKVDYILLWGLPSRRPLPIQKQVQNALTQFEPIYNSADHHVILYQRQGTQNALCTATPLNTKLASTN